MLRSSPTTPDVIADILVELKSTKSGIDLRERIQALLQLARASMVVDVSRAPQIRKAAAAAKPVIKKLAAELSAAGLGDAAKFWIRAANLAELHSRIRGPHGSMDGKQRTAAFFAILIIEQCSNDPILQDQGDNLHNVAWLVYRELFDGPQETAEGLGLLKACREVLAWHRDPRNPKYHGKFILPGLSIPFPWEDVKL
jgi:hypothetical protein